MITQTFIESVQSFGKQISLKITIGNDTYEKDDIMSCTKSFSGDLFTSIMQYVDIELSGLIDVKDKEVTVKFGVCMEEPYEYIDWGSFIIDNDTIEKSIDKNTTKFTAYDALCKSCVDYVDIVTYPITLSNYLSAICNYLGYTLMTTTFTNSTNSIEEEKFLTEAYTFRDVLDQIAGAAAGVIVLKGNNLYVKYPTDIDFVIDENNLKSLSLLDKFGPINSVVLSLQPQEDNYYKQDEVSIESNGLTEIKIANNEIMNKNREDYADAILERLNGLYFYPFEFESFGYAFFEPYDLITIKDLEGNSYQSVIMNDTVTVTTGLNEKVSTSQPETTVTDYSKATSSEKQLYRTILEVDKQNQTIIASVKSAEEKISTISNSITTSLSVNYVNSQTYDEPQDEYYPDYTTNPLKVTAITRDALKNEVADGAYTWKRKGLNDEDYVDLISGESASNNVLTISHNLSETTEYKAYIEVITDNGTVLTDEASICINLNVLNDVEVKGELCTIEATGNAFVENEGNYNYSSITLLPHFMQCNFILCNVTSIYGSIQLTLVENMQLLLLGH